MNKSAHKKFSSQQGSISTFKPKGGILHKSKAIDFNVYFNDLDVTPKPLNQQLFKAGKERQLNVVNMSGVDTSNATIDISSSQYQKSTSVGRFKTEMYTFDFNKSFLGTKVDDTFNFQSIMTDTESERVGEESELKSDYDLDRPKQVIPIPDKISLVLNETETFFILDLPSSTEIRDTEEGEQVEKLNADYEYLTTGKGKNRKVIEVKVQTHSVLKKSRETDGVRVKTASHTTFASNWEMYDTFLNEDKPQEKNQDEDGNHDKNDQHALNDTASTESFRQSSEEKQLCTLMNNDKFMQAVTVVERLLANNVFNVQQKRFKGMMEDNEIKEEIVYKYELDLLWNFANDKTEGNCVTSINWNPENEDIIVVAYGKFYFTDKTNGMVMIWNIKNPVQPERLYYFDESVSAVAFSIVQPYLIAVGMNNGIIKVVDIRERNLKVVHTSGKGVNASFETVNYLTFYSGDEHFNYEEQVLACFNDGRVCKYRLNLITELPCLQIMRAPHEDGKIKGIEKMTVCGVPAIPLTKYTGALLITFHPADPNIYYLCTNTGVIHKCSTNYFHQHLDLLLAHDGPIYQMQFSPFCNKLYVTCGGDWYIRIWAEGISEPLLELMTVMYPVQYVLWSPVHSTILVAIQDNQIQIWDLHRKVHYPQNIIKSPTGARNSAIQFTNNGKCLTVCDLDGNTFIYSLENMPIPAFFQDHLLYSAIKRNLITKPKLLKKFMDLKSLNFEKPVK